MSVRLISHIIFSIEDGVPYTVQIFAENSAGNGTVCNVTDFTNELGESHCSASVCGCLFSSLSAVLMSPSYKEPILLM